jgi:hypothetical protein
MPRIVEDLDPEDISLIRGVLIQFCEGHNPRIVYNLERLTSVICSGRYRNVEALGETLTSIHILLGQGYTNESSLVQYYLGIASDLVDNALEAALAAGSIARHMSLYVTLIGAAIVHEVRSVPGQLYSYPASE